MYYYDDDDDSDQFIRSALVEITKYPKNAMPEIRYLYLLLRKLATFGHEFLHFHKRAQKGHLNLTMGIELVTNNDEA